MTAGAPTASPTPTALVLGYGSVGRRHARILAGLSSRLAVVESGEAARAAARQDHPEALVVGTLEDLDSRVSAQEWSRAYAVIATWGPSHAGIFGALADRGLRGVLCEKPMASSVADACAMADRADREGIVLAVHHYIRYSGFAPALRARAAELSLGAPVGVLVRGGAACLVTNGVHWLDFAAEVFEGDPVAVMSSAAGQPINPRSPDLRIYGGTAVWDFGGGRETVMMLNNGSSVALEARVSYRDAVVDIDSDLRIQIRRRDPAAVARFPAVTRTGPADEVLFEGTLPGVLGYLDGMARAIEDVRTPGRLVCPARRGVVSVSACVGALLAARAGRTVDLPLGAGHEGFAEQFPIS
jgi:predicted dehydrogenase